MMTGGRAKRYGFKDAKIKSISGRPFDDNFGGVLSPPGQIIGTRYIVINEREREERVGLLKSFE
jgi:hypothetical protein